MEAAHTTKMMTNKDALKSRVESKRKVLEERLFQIRANAHHQALEERKRLQDQLDELNDALKEGWDRLSEGGARKVEEWLHA